MRSKFHWRLPKSKFGGFEKRDGTTKQFCQSRSELSATGLLRMWPCRTALVSPSPHCCTDTPPLPPIFADRRGIRMFTRTAQQPKPQF